MITTSLFRLCFTLLLALLCIGCAASSSVRMDAGATNDNASGRIHLNLPF